MLAALLVNQSNTNAEIIGFAPNWYFNQQSIGLSIYLSPGTFNGKGTNGQLVNVPANSTTLIWLDSNGVIQKGTVAPLGTYSVATVVSGQVLVGGNLPGGLGTLLFANGILSITDTRNFS